MITVAMIAVLLTIAFLLWSPLRYLFVFHGQAELFEQLASVQQRLKTLDELHPPAELPVPPSIDALPDCRFGGI